MFAGIMSATSSACFFNQRLAFIQERYHVIWKHPKATPADWTVFLLEELHLVSIQKINALFISRFGKRGDGVFVEGVPSFQCDSRPIGKRERQTLFIDSPNILPGNIVGWDVGYLDDTLLTVRSLLQFSFLFCWCSKPAWPAPHAMRYEICSQVYWTRSSVISRIIVPFILREILPLAERAKALLATKEIREIETLRLKARTQIKKKLRDVACQFHSQIAQDLPKRTESMVGTLHKIACCTNRSFYLLAGCLHLQEHFEYKGDPRYCLKPLYDFIRDKKQIVILQPKEISYFYAHYLKKDQLSLEYAASH